MKRIILSIVLVATAISMWGISLPDSLNYTFRIGYNIGGTAPVGMPATIRKLNSYDFQPNVSLGLDAVSYTHLTLPTICSV